MGARIVVIDAEPVVRFTVAAILEREGYEVTQTDDPLRGAELIRLERPALLITEVCLPQVTCHEVLHLYREHMPDLPVLILSALPDYEVVRRCREQGNIELFRKPFKASQLRERVRAMLGSKVKTAEAG